MGIKSKEKRTYTGKNEKQIRGDMFPTWSMLHEPEKSRLLGHVKYLWTGSTENCAQEQSIKVKTKEETYLQSPSHLLFPISQNLSHSWFTTQLPVSIIRLLWQLPEKQIHALQLCQGICAELFFRQLGYAGSCVSRILFSTFQVYMRPDG